MTIFNFPYKGLHTLHTGLQYILYNSMIELYSVSNHKYISGEFIHIPHTARPRP